MVHMPEGKERLYGADLADGLSFEATIVEYSKFDVKEVRILDSRGKLIRRHSDRRGSFEALEEAKAAAREQATDLTRKPG
jgi:hypothetical protein